MSRTIILLAFLAAMRTAFAETYYVSPEGVDDTMTGRGGESMPFATPRYALSKATTAGDEVRVMKGVYYLDAPAEIHANDVTLRGWNATREEVVFDAQGNCRCLQFPTNSSGLVATIRTGTFVSGITFRNGRNRISNNYVNWLGLGAGVLLAGNTGNESSGSFATVSNCVIASCVNETSFGGGLVVGSGSKVVDCVITNNIVCAAGDGSRYGGSYGGAGAYAYSFNGDTTFERCTFADNIATNGPAAIGSGAYSFVPEKGKSLGLVIRDCTFTHNVSRESTASNNPMGAGCFTQRARLVEDCTFWSNRVEAVAGSSATPQGGVFRFIYDFGGAMTNTFRRCHFLWNYAEYSSGVVAGGSCPIMFEECTFQTNSAPNRTVLTSSGTIIMRDSLVKGNTSGGPGGWRGIIYVTGKSNVIERCDFIDNKLQGYLGVVRLAGSDSLVDRCRFINNQRPNSASCDEFGALEIASPNGIVRNCLFAGNVNWWQPGAGLLLYKCDNTVVENCTFVNNKTGLNRPFDLGAGISRNSGTAPTGIVIRNCLFSNNGCYAATTAAPQIPSEFRNGVTYSWTSTDELTVSAETHNVAVGDGLPHFDTKKANAYTPSLLTPGLNRGFVNHDWMDAGHDLYGQRRIQGSAPDFGCVERDYFGMLLMVR